MVSKHMILGGFYFWFSLFNKTIIPFTLVGYEIVIANLALRASLAIYHLISNTRAHGITVNYLVAILICIRECILKRNESVRFNYSTYIICS